MIIYKTTNIIDNKIYIGKNLNNNPNYLGSGLHLKSAIKKYGKENFRKEVIEYCSSLSEMNIREIYWIDLLNSRNPSIGYNISIGGDGGKTRENVWNKGLNKNIDDRVKKIGAKNKFSLKGKKQTEESIEKRRTKLKGIKRSPEVSEKISNSLKGRKMSSESKERISKKLRGRKLTEESIKRRKGKKMSNDTKEKISKKLKGKSKNINMSGKNNPNYIHLSEEIIRNILYLKKMGDSLRKISKVYDVSVSLILRVIKENS